jgi:hypothetical protein
MDRAWARGSGLSGSEDVHDEHEGVGAVDARLGDASGAVAVSRRDDQKDAAADDLADQAARDSGATFRATSWVLPAVGMPVPMSRNCRIPVSAAR